MWDDYGGCGDDDDRLSRMGAMQEEDEKKL